MKTKLKILKLLSGGFAILLLFTFSNCNDMDCHDYPPGGKLIYDFHEEDSLKIPYTGTDTLTFLRTKGSTVKDTVVFIGQGKKYELVWLRYENEESDCQYSVYAKKHEINYVAQNEPDLKFRFTRTAGEGSSDLIDFNLKNVNFQFIFWRWDWGYGFYEYITFNNQVYRKVKKIIKNYNSISNILYYNFEYGIIRIELDYLNETYQLIN